LVRCARAGECPGLHLAIYGSPRLAGPFNDLADTQKLLFELFHGVPIIKIGLPAELKYGSIPAKFNPMSDLFGHLA
jgi:hypothetical protein